MRSGIRISQRYNSRNIEDIRGKKFDLLICAGARGSRRLAVMDPAQDWSEIERLMECLRTTEAERFVLISTVEIYNYHNEVDEDFQVDAQELPSYALHRYQLEIFCKKTFNCHIIRLPIIFGIGLKKNIVFDLLNGQYNFTNRDDIYQFYDLNHIWQDILKTISLNLPLVNLFSEPIHVSSIASEIFNVKLSNTSEPLRQFDIHCKYWRRWGNTENYLYSTSSIYSSLSEFVKMEKRLFS